MSGRGVAAWGLLFAACVEPVDSACLAADGLHVQLGTGDEDFVDLEEGGPLPFVAGQQGGHHVFVSLRARGLVPGTGQLGENDHPRVALGLDAGGVRLSGFELHPLPFDDGGEEVELIGQLLALSHPDPPSLDEATASLWAEVEDRCGQRADDALDVVLQLRRGR